MNIYNSTYQDSNPSWHAEDAPWKANQILTVIKKNHITPSSVCEVGCGTGDIIVNLSKKLPLQTVFHGYDISPLLIDKWKTRTQDNISFFNEDITQKTEPSYDLILCIDVVEHIEDYIGFLRQIKSRAPFFIFNFPLEIFALQALFGKSYLYSRKKYGHLHYFNKDICLAVLKDLKYDIVDYFYAPMSIDLAGSSTSASFATKALCIPRMVLSLLNVNLTAKLLGGYSLFVLARDVY